MLHIAIPGRPTFLLTPGRTHLSMSAKIRSRKASCEYKCWSPIRSAGKSPRHLMSSSISSMRTSPRSSCGLRIFLMPCLAKIAQILQNIRQNRHSCMGFNLNIPTISFVVNNFCILWQTLATCQTDDLPPCRIRCARIVAQLSLMILSSSVVR